MLSKESDLDDCEVAVVLRLISESVNRVVVVVLLHDFRLFGDRQRRNRPPT
jgi:hypothetical protein